MLSGSKLLYDQKELQAHPLRIKFYLCILYLNNLTTMATQSEAALENGLIKTLMDNSYERVFIKEEENLKANFKVRRKAQSKGSRTDRTGAIYRQRIRANSHLPRRRDTV